MRGAPKREEVEEKELCPWLVQDFMRIPLASLLVDLKPAAKIVYQVLVWRWWKGHDKWFAGFTVASHADLSTETELSVSSVRRALAEIESFGLVKVKAAPGGAAAYYAQPLSATMVADARARAKSFVDPANGIEPSRQEEFTKLVET